MSKNALNSLFTKESLFSLQGAAAATLIIPNVLGYLIGPAFTPYQKWTAFGIALALAFYTAAQAPSKEAGKWFMAIFNGFLIFASAAGLTDALGAGQNSGITASGVPQATFFHSWFH
jgi:hypothetical protein